MEINLYKKWLEGKGNDSWLASNEEETRRYSHIPPDVDVNVWQALRYFSKFEWLIPRVTRFTRKKKL